MKTQFILGILLFLAFSVQAQFDPSQKSVSLGGLRSEKFRIPVQAGTVLTSQVTLRSTSSGGIKKWVPAAGAAGAYAVQSLTTPKAGSEAKTSHGIPFGVGAALAPTAIGAKRSKALLELTLFDKSGKRVSHTLTAGKIGKSEQVLSATMTADVDGFAEVRLSNEGKNGLTRSGFFLQKEKPKRIGGIDRQPGDQSEFYVQPIDEGGNTCTQYWPDCNCNVPCGYTYNQPVVVTASAPDGGLYNGWNSSVSVGSGGYPGNGSPGGTPGGTSNASNSSSGYASAANSHPYFAYDIQSNPCAGFQKMLQLQSSLNAEIVGVKTAEGPFVILPAAGNTPERSTISNVYKNAQFDNVAVLYADNCGGTPCLKLDLIGYTLSGQAYPVATYTITGIVHTHPAGSNSPSVDYDQVFATKMANGTAAFGAALPNVQLSFVNYDYEVRFDGNGIVSTTNNTCR